MRDVFKYVYFISCRKEWFIPSEKQLSLFCGRERETSCGDTSIYSFSSLQHVISTLRRLICLSGRTVRAIYMLLTFNCSFSLPGDTKISVFRLHFQGIILKMLSKLSWKLIYLMGVSHTAASLLQFQNQHLFLRCNTVLEQNCGLLEGRKTMNWLLPDWNNVTVNKGNIKVVLYLADLTLS